MDNTNSPNILKRDGRLVFFNPSKIKDTLLKAYNSINDKPADEEFNTLITNIINSIESLVNKSKKEITVEQIQDIIEKKLMNSKFKDVAKSFILYRNKRTQVRENKSTIMSIIKDKIQAENVVNQNANVDEKSFGGRAGEVRNAVLKEYALNNCMSEMAKYNHLNNRVYIHDLDNYAVGCHNCLTIDFQKLLRYGFKVRQTDIRPPRSVSTAFQLVAVIFQIQSLCQFGGVGNGHIDWDMVPYVRYSLLKQIIKLTAYENDIFEDEAKEELYNKLFEIFKVNNIDDIVYDNNKNLIETLKNIYKDNSKVFKRSLDTTESEIYQSVEGLYHNLNSLQSRSGNQLQNIIMVAI